MYKVSYSKMKKVRECCIFNSKTGITLASMPKTAAFLFSVIFL